MRSIVVFPLLMIIGATSCSEPVEPRDLNASDMAVSDFDMSTTNPIDMDMEGESDLTEEDFASPTPEAECQVGVRLDRISDSFFTTLCFDDAGEFRAGLLEVSEPGSLELVGLSPEAILQHPAPLGDGLVAMKEGDLKTFSYYPTEVPIAARETIEPDPPMGLTYAILTAERRVVVLDQAAIYQFALGPLGLRQEKVVNRPSMAGSRGALIWNDRLIETLSSGNGQSRVLIWDLNALSEEELLIGESEPFEGLATSSSISRDGLLFAYSHLGDRLTVVDVSSTPEVLNFWNFRDFYNLPESVQTRIIVGDSHVIVRHRDTSGGAPKHYLFRSSSEPECLGEIVFTPPEALFVNVEQDTFLIWNSIPKRQWKYEALDLQDLELSPCSNSL